MRNGQSTWRERSSLAEFHFSISISYGSVGPVPRPPGIEPPPPYSITPGNSGRGYRRTIQQAPSPPHSTPTPKGQSTSIVVLLFLVAQLMVLVFFYDLLTTVGRYNKAIGRIRVREAVMRKEAKYLESERIALQYEREKWEKAREDRVPQGAFWESVQSALDCLSYGKREYSGILRNIPEGWTDMDACMNMPTEIKGVPLRRPDRCLYVKDSPYIHGFWTVDWDQPDCRPWHQDFNDLGCTNTGSETRRIEARVVGINEKGNQDWRLLCESTPMTWNHTTYNAPTHCYAQWIGKKMAMWDISDKSC